MRGDSVRDFYAKTLALLGLGALASVGALVDYWPAKLDIPRVEPIRTAAVLGAVPAAPALATLTKAEEPSAVVRPARYSSTEFVADESSPVGLFGAVASDTEDLFSVLDSARVLPPQPEHLDVVRVVAWTLPVRTTDVLTPLFMTARLDDDAKPFRVQPVPQTPDSPSSDGIVGVLKKTGSGIAMVGVKTGSTIVGAFRAVGGAFRKIL